MIGIFLSLSFFLSYFLSFFLSFFLIQSSVHSSLLINLFFSHSSIFSLSLCYNFSFSLSVSILTFLLFHTLTCVYIFSPSLCFYSSFTLVCLSVSLFCGKSSHFSNQQSAVNSQTLHKFSRTIFFLLFCRFAKPKQARYKGVMKRAVK